jgi:predicted ArsR family transcriptional regulator
MGKYKSTFTDYEILDFLASNRGASSLELALKFGITRQGVHFRMKRLIYKGWVFEDVGAGRNPTRYWAHKQKPWVHKI